MEFKTTFLLVENLGGFGWESYVQIPKMGDCQKLERRFQCWKHW